MKHLITPQVRGTDDYGSGAYGASRGNRKHNGLDFIVLPKQEVFALNDGIVTKLGYPYADDLRYRYVEVTDSDENRLRYFYVDPGVSKGAKLLKGAVIGTAQDLGRRYSRNGKTITPHIHFEVILKGNHIDPEEYLASI
jgi:murein DD-endopeptidase MepM/ murein hydrolase activator NlpD